MSEHCLYCGHKIPGDVHACPACGVQHDIDDSKRIHAPCPRCKDVRLIQFALESVALQACGRCQGSFLPASEWDVLVETFVYAPLPWIRFPEPPEPDAIAEESAYRSAARPSAAAPSAPPDLEAPVSCPTCGDRMERLEFAGVSGIVVDVCGMHGIWLDGGELARVVGVTRQKPIDPLGPKTAEPGSLPSYVDDQPVTRRAPIRAPSRIEGIVKRLLALRSR